MFFSKNIMVEFDHLFRLVTALAVSGVILGGIFSFLESNEDRSVDWYLNHKFPTSGYLRDAFDLLPLSKQNKIIHLLAINEVDAREFDFSCEKDAEDWLAEQIHKAIGHAGRLENDLRHGARRLARFGF